MTGLLTRRKTGVTVDKRPQTNATAVIVMDRFHG